MGTQTLAQTLAQDAKLAPLLRQLRLYAQLLEQIQAALPQPLSAHCLYCVLRSGGRLILYADSAAWAAKLRFYQAKIKAALAAWGPVESVRVRVLLPEVDQTKSPPRLVQPAPQTLERLDQAAAEIADPKLRRSVQRLIRTLRHKT